MQLQRMRSRVNDDTNRINYDLSVKWQVAWLLKINTNRRGTFFNGFSNMWEVSEILLIVSAQVTTVISTRAARVQ